jgi:hypothetical protein
MSAARTHEPRRGEKGVPTRRSLTSSPAATAACHRPRSAPLEDAGRSCSRFAVDGRNRFGPERGIYAGGCSGIPLWHSGGGWTILSLLWTPSTQRGACRRWGTGESPKVLVCSQHRRKWIASESSGSEYRPTAVVQFRRKWRHPGSGWLTIGGPCRRINSAFQDTPSGAIPSVGRAGSRIDGVSIDNRHPGTRIPLGCQIPKPA